MKSCFYSRVFNLTLQRGNLKTLPKMTQTKYVVCMCNINNRSQLVSVSAPTSC